MKFTEKKKETCKNYLKSKENCCLGKFHSCYLTLSEKIVVVEESLKDFCTNVQSVIAEDHHQRSSVVFKNKWT